MKSRRVKASDEKGLRHFLLTALATTFCAASAFAQDVKIIGSGASFPFPIYSAWFKEFNARFPGVAIEYQAKGSGAGVQDFINGAVDFAASDAAMTDVEIAKVDRGVVLLPMTGGNIVLAYNLPNALTGLRLPRDVYPEIFLGKINRWSDPKIVAANPDLKLPDLPITVVRRSDSSGTNFVFTKHLSAIDPTFKSTVGFGVNVRWPSSDKFVAAPRNDGVVATIEQIAGAIGYVEYGFARQAKLPMALLENKSGVYVEPSVESGRAALARAIFPSNLVVWVNDPEGYDCYPIVTFTWMLFYKNGDPTKAAYLRKMVDYALVDGQKIADDMGYIPLPPYEVGLVRAAAKEIK